MDNKTNDWFAARLMNIDKPVEFLISEGIDATNSEMQDKDFYKSKPKVQEAFKHENGGFDKDKYDKFYDDISLEFTYLNSIDTENFILNAYEKSGSNFSTDFGTVVNPKITTSAVTNPQDLSFGLINTNEWSLPTKSIRESAQKNQYFDKDTGKWSDKTVNESGALGLLSDKPLVYATWNSDGKHIDQFSGKEESHKKDEWKTDEFGNFYAETVSNEDSIGKQFVTMSEVLTDDESPWNKIDVFDSDNIDSNIARTLIKGTALVGASVLFPTVGSTLFYTTASVNLARVLPQISKSLLAFFGTEDFDTLNKWDNSMRKYGGSSSDYSQEHFFSLENILNMAIDSYMQLGTQRAIAQIPQKLGIGSNAAKQMAAAEGMQRIKLAQSGKVSQEVIEALTKGTDVYRNASKVFNNASKVSTAISRGYLVATSVEDVYNSAKSYGFDSQTAGFISLATYAGIGTLFQTDYFRGMLTNSSDYEVARDIKLLTRQWLKNSSEAIKKDLSTATSEVVKQSKLKYWGNSILNHVKKHVEDVSSGKFGVVSGAINEGLEEVAEEVTQDLSYQIGKSWQSIKELYTGNTYKNEYSYASTDPLARYGMSLFGGAMGGAIFRLSDRFHFQKNAYSNWKDMMGGDNSQLMKELIYHVSQGHTSTIIKQIDKLQESSVLSSSISAFTGQATTNIDESQNHVIFNMFKKSINDIDSFLNNNNLAIDYDRFGDIELLKGVRTAWLTSAASNGKGIQNSLFEDYQKRVTEIINLNNDIQSKRLGLSDNAKQEEIDVVKTETSKLQKVLDFKIEQVRKLVDGKDESYIGRLMLETNKDILDKIVPTSKEGLSKYLYGIEYLNLPTIYKNEIDKRVADGGESGLTEVNYMSAWNIYKSISGDESLRKTFGNIDKTFNKFISVDTLSHEDLKEFLVAVEAFKTLEPLWSESQVLNLFYKSKGIDTPVFDFQDDGVIEPDLTNSNFINDADELYSSWENISKSAFDKINEDPSIVDTWIHEYNSGSTNKNLTTSEAFSLLTRELSRDRFNSIITSMYNSLEGDPMNFGLGLQGRTMISSKDIDSLINSINSKVDGTDNINLIMQQYGLFKSQGNKYFMSSEVNKSFANLKDILSLTESISEGSDENRHVDIIDIPFGANNYLNKAFKEKGINLELSQVSSNTVSAIKDRINYLKDLIDLLKDADIKNKGAVITTEKKIGIKHSEFKIKTIQALLESPNTSQELKDKLKELDFTISRLEDITTDDDYIQVSSNYRNIILQFEREFFNYWSSLDDVKKVDFIKNITTVFNKNLIYDTGALSADIISEEGEILNDSTSYMYLLSCSFGNSDIVTKEYKDSIQNSNMFPFDSQEDIILTVSKFLLRDSKDDIKLWVDTILSDTGAIEKGLTKLYRAIKLVCSGGTGKTSALLPGIFNIISKVIPNKNVIFASNTNDQIIAINANISNVNSILISDILNDSINKDSFKSKYENSIIFIDECTNIDISDLKVLDNLSTAYNVDIVYLGDVKQHSNGISIDGCVCTMTNQLTESKRSSTDISRRNNNIFEKLFKQNSTGTPDLNPLVLDNFTYWESSNTIEGVKFEDTRVLTNEFIENFYNKYNLTPETKMLIFSNNLSTININNLSKKYNITFADNFANIQGIEWDYVLTDINLNVVGDGKSLDYLQIYGQLKDIYTLFTRYKHGLISLQPLVLKDLTPNTKGLYIADSTHNELSIFSPVESGIINNKEALQQFIDYKYKVLNNINLIDKELPITEDELDVSSKSNVVQKPFKSSLAQVASGFLLKKNFTDEFIQEIGVSKEQYGIVRNILYSMLTTDSSDSLRDKLPELLRNGKFLIKIEYSTVKDLYDMGNLYRDDKSLRGVHPWIVYHIDGYDNKDIYLGMFQNTETSQVNNSNMSHTSFIINSLTSNSLPSTAPRYYEISDKLNISRSANIIDIQNKETDSGAHIGLTYIDGKIIGTNINGSDQRIDFLETSLSIYFRRGNENIVKVNSILDELNNLRTLYSKFYDLSLTKGLYTTDVESIKELLHYNRKDNKWDARGVPDLEDKFVIFTKLQMGDKQNSQSAYLQNSSNSYLITLREKSKQIVDIIQILESAATDDFKKEKIDEILSNRILFDSVPISFDPDLSTDIESFKEAIDNITYDTFMGDQRSRKSYNDAITHQFGNVLRRIAALVKYGDQLKLANSSVSWFDNKDLSSIKMLWNKYKDPLINAYRKWTELSDINEDSLLSFLTETFTKSYSGKHQETVPIFMNNNSHLLQTYEFKQFLQEVYLSKTWPIMAGKLNTLKYFNQSPEVNVMFGGHLFPHIIKDNGINILTKGDALTIPNKATFIINSKVIQQGRIFIYGDDSISTEDFKEYSKQSNSMENKAIKPITIKKSKISTNKTKFKNELLNIGRNSGKRIALEDRQSLGDLIEQIGKNDNDNDNEKIIKDAILQFAKDGDFNIFSNVVKSLSQTTPEQVKILLDNILAIITNYIDLC